MQVEKAPEPKAPASEAERSRTEAPAPSEAPVVHGNGTAQVGGRPPIAPPGAPSASGRRKPPVAVIGVVAVALAVGGVFGVRWYEHSLAFVSTDDAQIAGNLVTVSPKVPGEIAQLMVDEGSQVKAGQVIAKLDDEDFKAQLAQAQAALAVARTGLSPTQIGVTLQTDQSETQLTQAEAGLRAARAQLAAAEANDLRATTDYQRALKLYQGGGASKQQLDGAQTAKVAADSQLTAAQSQVRNAEAGLKMAHAGTEAIAIKAQGVNTMKARIAQAMAAVDMAQLQVEHATITSPVDGTVAKRMVNVGEHVMPGQGLFDITQSGALWVEAMIQETSIARVHAGSPVNISVDAYPGKVFKGHVALVNTVTGAQFSLLPQDNSQGNYTKVVQRIPVRIDFDRTSDLLKPGMSVEVDISADGK